MQRGCGLRALGAEFLPAAKLNFLATPGSFRWLKTEQNIQRRPYRRRPPDKTARRTPALRSSTSILLYIQMFETIRGSQEIEFSRRFQPAERQQKRALPGSRLPPPPLPGAAGRDCPPARNCPRRIAPVGPDSTLPAPKKRFFSLRQCRMANVADLSGLTVAWRRVFRAAGQACPADTGATVFEQGFCHFSAT